MKSGSNLERILKSGEFAVTGELGPPKNADPEIVRKKARILKGHVDAVNITDCQTAIVRMSSISAGLLTQAEGVEPVIQMTCRDRNRIGMQSDILGASALGLKNLLCLTGDHQKFGNHPGSKGVFDMDSIQMLGMLRELQDKRKFQCGEELKGEEPKLFLGCAANPFAGPAKFRAARLGKKVANGADFVQTQIVYNVEKFSRFMEMARDLGIDEKTHILAGVTPPKSLGMARYMKKFVPGMDVPDEIIQRMKDAKDKEDEGINICVGIINQVKEIKGVAGVHVMAIEWESAVPEIVSRAQLGDRPVIEAEVAAAVEDRETIEIRSASPVVDTSDESDSMLADAKVESVKIIAAARDEVSRMKAGSPAAIEIEDAGEHEMNEKERQMALESVSFGLKSLKKAFGLTEDQFVALSQFAGAEAILKKEPAATTPTPAASSTPTPSPDQSTDDSAAEDVAAEDVAAEDVAAEDVADKKAADEKAAAAKAEADKKIADEKAAATKAEADKKIADEKATAAKAEADKKTADEKAAVASKPAVASSVGAAELAVEEAPLADRASKVPADHYAIQYSGTIKETALGNGDGEVIVGGATSMPFQLFEGDMPRKPLIAMDIFDIAPDEWPEPLANCFEGVMGNPVDWAQKCINDYQAEALCISLVSTDPNGMNRDSAAAAKDAADVVAAVDVPVIVWGCGNSEKDTETLREVTAMVGDKKVCLAPLSDANYRSLGASAMAFQHPMVAASPIDVNLAKQLNILLENLGVPLDTVLMDPSIGALGYGIEYTYSVMERIRLAALTQQDKKLQVPFICNLGREVWKAKETKLPSDNLIGDQERRGVLMEALTASCMLMAGGEIMIMRHPRAVALTKSLINGLMG